MKIMKDTTLKQIVKDTVKMIAKQAKRSPETVDKPRVKLYAIDIVDHCIKRCPLGLKRPPDSIEKVQPTCDAGRTQFPRSEKAVRNILLNGGQVCSMNPWVSKVRADLANASGYGTVDNRIGKTK